MELKIIRTKSNTAYTEGKLYIDGAYFCATLEDQDRGLYQHMSLAEIKAVKVYGETCIPYGTYKVELSYSPKFKKIMPVILDVKGFIGVRIHNGSYTEHTLGCPLVGIKYKDGMLTNSRKTFNELMQKLQNQKEITITIEHINEKI